ncbi:hypothetical protein D5S18_09240 [Nocardia panacis]|uniref:Transglycosylase SLT domain-containing protein n=1 Tax=Nocardia panacis TaxID=2340916 RepID=A0A3A4JYT4_9NOCA|nr:transglycosylase SLT domain-containing protein [Nocardia panacis]RJO76485.1 hypothetical protein D5S18_09240 [Nocardia panacis]
MALTIPDIEQWNPQALATAGTHAKTVYEKLDGAEQKGITDTQGLNWNGAAGNAAAERMNTEKTRASEVSKALQELETAFTSQVDNLANAKSKVLQLRDQARGDSAHPGLEVLPNGTVSAAARIARLGPDASDKVVLQEELAAAQWEHQITNALAEAEKVATAAQTAVSTAAGKLDAAYGGLGDPKSVAPAPNTRTAPTAVTTSAATSESKSSYSTGGGGSQHHGSSGGSGYGAPSGGGVPSSGRVSTAPLPAPTGDMADWIRKAKEELIKMGYSPDQIDERALALIIEKESGGNPLIVNEWDSNWVAGHPSKGLMQTIDSTFDAYKADGHGNIFDPVDNIIAGTRYAIATYGSLSNVPGVVAVDSGQAYQGY